MSLYMNLYTFLIEINPMFVFESYFSEHIIYGNIHVNGKKPDNINMRLNNGDIVTVFGETHMIGGTKYLVRLNFPFDPNVESLLYVNNVLVEGCPEYGVYEITVKTGFTKEKLLEECSVDIGEILQEVED